MTSALRVGSASGERSLPRRFTALDPPRPRKTLHRFLRVVVEACDLPGGRIEFDGSDDGPWSTTVGEGSFESGPITLTVPRAGASVRLVLGPPTRTGNLSARDRAAVERALVAVAAELP